MSESTDQAQPAAAEGAERRAGIRHEFPYVQKVAPMTDGEVPPAEKFFSVRCKDLSTGGISIVLDSSPEFDQLVVALGVEPELRHVTARVANVDRFEEDGLTRYQVGCQFIGRVRR